MASRTLWAGPVRALEALTEAAGRLIPGWRLKPEERERRRRLRVNAEGRTGSAIITDFRDGVLCYTYSVAGVEYAACQDVRTLSALLPANPFTLLARPATLKYLTRNPANSILLCEGWSGLQFGP